MCFTKNITAYIFIVCGALLAVGFSTLVALWQTIFFSVLEKKLIVAENTLSYDVWKETPFPVYLEIFLYNFTNSDEVMKNNSIKPIFEENGPYVFREHHIKVNLIWNPNGTVSFYQRRIYNYVPERSMGCLTDNITNMNMIAVSAAYSSRFKSTFEKLALNTVLNLYAEGVVVTKTAGELLFDGYEDRLLSLIESLNISSIVDLPYDKFGWFYARNLSDTFDGLFNMHTGSADIYKLGVMDTWNGEENVGYYDGECGEVRGSAGELFPPGGNPDSIEVFATDICSYLTLNRHGTKEINGITGTLFSADDSPFDNGANYPEQACFCSEGSCPPWGSRNVSLCRMGAPAFISFPHFNLAHPSYTDRIDGMIADEKRDRFQMILELSTGVPLYVKAQLQINIQVQRIPGISYFNKMPDNIYMPMLWFRQEVYISDDLANELRHALSLRECLPILFYALSGMGLVLVVVGMIIRLWKITSPRAN